VTIVASFADLGAKVRPHYTLRRSLTGSVQRTGIKTLATIPIEWTPRRYLMVMSECFVRHQKSDVLRTFQLIRLDTYTRAACNVSAVGPADGILASTTREAADPAAKPRQENA